MKWHLGMAGWQIGCLLGLAVGLVQAISGNLEIASLPPDEGLARLVATMLGGAVLCGLGAAVLSATGRGEESQPD